MKKGDKLMCIKDLYKSTYEENAFDAGKEYIVSDIDKFYWVTDNMGNPFTFTILHVWGICDLLEYFKEI